MNLATSATLMRDRNSRLNARTSSVFRSQASPQAGSLRHLILGWRQAGVEPQHVVAVLTIV